jgi:hypothetical protein
VQKKLNMKRICPQEEVLADYLAGRLAAENKSDLESHLSDCRRCLDEIMLAEDLMQGNTLSGYELVPPSVTQSAIELVKSRTRPAAFNFKKKIIQIFKHFYSWISVHTPLIFHRRDSLAPIRSSEKIISSDFFHVKKSFREIIVDLEIEKTGREFACVRVNLISDSKNKNNIRVTLLGRNERELASSPLKTGLVLFEEIAFGHYRLAFVRNGTRIGMYRFEIKDSSHAR